MDQHPDQFSVGRRRFLQATLGGLAAYLAGVPPVAAQAGYLVGVGHSSDPYSATRRAVEASGEWPAATISGRTVVIKPNLVSGRRAETGVTTDPQVVRAIVDLALEAGAGKVLIVEHGSVDGKFVACGYGFFNNYDSSGRVELMDLSGQAATLQPVPDGGMAYSSIYMPQLLLQDDVVYVSVAKLKTHVDAMATLAMKNAFGLPPIKPYQDSWIEGRFAMHKRSVSQTIVDLNLVRPIDFAVVDGIWGLEGNGPLFGTAVRMDTVLAGRNALAVDRVGLEMMRIPQDSVQHLEYAARRGLGPATIGEVVVQGDPLATRSFKRAVTPPSIEYPTAEPSTFTPGAGQQVAITYGVDRQCWTRVEIVRTSEERPTVTHIRLLQDWTSRPAGIAQLAWDGRNYLRWVVKPGVYRVRVRAAASPDVNVAYATGVITVAAKEA